MGMDFTKGIDQESVPTPSIRLTVKIPTGEMTIEIDQDVFRSVSLLVTNHLRDRLQQIEEIDSGSIPSDQAWYPDPEVTERFRKAEDLFARAGGALNRGWREYHTIE